MAIFGPFARLKRHFRASTPPDMPRQTILEAITGQLYLAILLARLVSLEVAGRS